MGVPNSTNTAHSSPSRVCPQGKGQHPINSLRDLPGTAGLRCAGCLGGHWTLWVQRAARSMQTPLLKEAVRGEAGGGLQLHHTHHTCAHTTHVHTCSDTTRAHNSTHTTHAHSQHICAHRPHMLTGVHTHAHTHTCSFTAHRLMLSQAQTASQGAPPWTQEGSRQPLPCGLSSLQPAAGAGRTPLIQKQARLSGQQ